MLKLTQEMKLSQKLDFRMIQSLKLLPLTVMQLEQRIQEEIEMNPMLQVDETIETEERKPQNEQSSTRNEDDSAEKNGDFTEADWTTYLEDGFENDYDYRPERDPNEDVFESTGTYNVNLADHLTEQLGMVVRNDYERAIGEFIIGSINEDGFLEISDEEIAKNLDIPVENVSAMVEIIQGFDPPGIAAHDLRESLLIQLKERGEENSFAWKIIISFYNELTNRKFAEIMRALSLSEEKLKEAIEVISTLTPKPGASFNPSGNISVIPDIIVEKIEGKYVVMLNDWSIPHLTINNGYRKLLNRGADTPPETKKYLVDKLNSAKWFINSIEQRRSTIMKVASAIVESQKDFLDKGLSYLKPLTLQDIAEPLGIAVSTVQRVTSGKYIQTPKGVLELKYFFGQRISSSDGTEDVSSKSVKEKLKEIIEKENTKKPLSDQIIAETLNKMGVSISRRAIAKYRDELHIPSARLRKQL